MINSEKMLTTLEYLKKNQQNHAQEVWLVGSPLPAWNALTPEAQAELLATPVNKIPEGICGTKFCFAGAAGLLFDFPAPTLKTVLDEGAFLQWYSPEDGEHVSDWARRELGLTVFMAEVLFDGDNTFERLEEFVNWLAENPDATDELFAKNFDLPHDSWCNECEDYH